MATVRSSGRRKYSIGDAALCASPRNNRLRHRLISLLVRLAQEQRPAGNTADVVLPASNQELAAQIGTVRELVSRNLSRLQAEGLIRIEGRTVTLTNVKALQAILEARDRIQSCQLCGSLTESQPCGICTDARRDSSLLCVVEQAVDIVRRPARLKPPSRNNMAESLPRNWSMSGKTTRPFRLTPPRTAIRSG